MQTKIFILICLLFSAQLLSAQNRSCASHDHLQQQLLDDPERQSRLDAIEKHTSQIIKNQGFAEVNGVITIPVVVHVVYKTAAQNLSVAQIQSQIDVLNEDFRRLNSDANNTWSQAADSEVEFCLATVDPNGSATTGITRTQTNVTTFTDDDKVKFNNQGGHDAWPAADYLNIWTCNLDGFLGYAQFPGGPANTDGVVCAHQYFGTTGTATAPFDLGRTATHEVGHYLNLYHIWGDGGCNVDDQVADTPKSDAPNYGCATGHTSCSTPDMIENYMDYSDDGCMNLFTTGQKNRMRALFEPGGFRESLLNSTACNGGGGSSCNTPAGLAVNNVNNTSATISWNTVSSAQNYTLQYRVTSASTWTSQSVTSTSYNLTGLTACTTYNFRVRTNCASENSSFTASQNFSTTGCSSGCQTNEVTLTLIPDDYGSETTWEVKDGNTVLYSGGPYSNNNSDPVTEVFCLDNGCYDFVIYDSYGDGICCAYGNGSYTVTDANNNTLASGGEFTNEESTNFCLGSTPPPATCESPTPTRVVYPNNNTLVRIFWNQVPSASKYIIRYRVIGTNPWTTKQTNQPAVQLTNINSSATYEYQLAAKCASGWTSYSARYQFSRNLNACIAPVPKNVNNITSSSAKVWWHKLNNATTYRVIYRPIGTTSWTTINSTSLNAALQNLSANTTYQFRLRGFCSGSWTSWSPFYNFTTSSGSSRDDFEDKTDAIEKENISLNVYPNPSRGLVNIQFENISENAKLSVFNMVGERVREIENINTSSNSLEINLNNLPQGMYIIKVEDGKKSALKKLTIVN